jgi:two-component system NtrC family sensor kinase
MLLAIILGVPLLMLALMGGAWLILAPYRLLAIGVTSAAVALTAAIVWPAARRVARRMASLERQRAAFYQELMRLSKAAGLGELASSIAHDLNNPLAIMHEEAGWIQDLLKEQQVAGNPTLEEIANSVDQIDVQIKRSREITQRILHWARDVESRATEVDLNALLNKTLYLLEGELHSSDVKVVKELASGLPAVKGEASELRQVFLNLMKNALDAMRSGGGTLKLITASDAGLVRVTIEDTGAGIEQGLMDKVFEPFFTTKPPGEGTGLGLPISRWIVKKLGGRIEVESEPERGTAFHVLLPASDRDAKGHDHGRVE